MCTRTEVGLALDGAHVYLCLRETNERDKLVALIQRLCIYREVCTYIPESLWMAFCTSKRLVVRRPFSVTKLIPPRGLSKFITYQGINDSIKYG